MAFGRRMPSRWRSLALLMLAFGWLGAVPASVVAQSPTVLAARVDGAITPVIADYLVDGVREGERGGHEAFLVEIDTPGGLDTSMRKIVRTFLDADVPVVVHVAPSGARAASAGALITFSAHVAAMAPGTTIGAATPVDLQGGDISDKIINDAAAFAESVTAQRGRIPALLVLAWPSVWQSADQLRPHLVRARSGNYGLILVGTDEEIEAAKLDTTTADTDLIAEVSPIGVSRLLLILRSRAEPPTSSSSPAQTRSSAFTWSLMHSRKWASAAKSSTALPICLTRSERLPAKR